MASISDSLISVRPAQESDLPLLTDIYNAAVTGTTATGHFIPVSLEERRPWWFAHQDPRYPILVLVLGNDVLGYASLSQWFDTPVYARTAESSLYLAPHAQGRGLGTTLMKALLEEAGSRGHHVVLSRIWAQNAPSIAMCRKCGYETVGIQREVGLRNGEWEDCVIMQIILCE